MRARYTVLLIVGLTATGQAQKANRTPWGYSALQGIWSNASLTPLERPANFKDREFLTDEEAAALEKGGLAPLLKILAREVQVSGELNDTWLEPGTKVDRNRRTSMITDPKTARRRTRRPGRKRATPRPRPSSSCLRPPAHWIGIWSSVASSTMAS